jgi:hypothetical protein
LKDFLKESNGKNLRQEQFSDTDLINGMIEATAKVKAIAKAKANAKSQKTAFIVIGIIVAIIVVAVIASQNVFKIGFSNPPDLNTYVPTILILIILLYICCKW